MALNAVFGLLEQGAKGYPASIDWFKRIKEDRDSDELMFYLRMARNVEEHGIDNVILINRTTTFKSKKGGQVRVSKLDYKGGVRIDSLDGSGLLVQSESRPALAPIINRKFNQRHAVPKVHKGNSVEGVWPKEAGELAYAYCAETISAAAQLIDPGTA